ncbi:hypothetical protein SAMD00024442_99_4 [Candidatus Symbiothrix dinenymphae]|nr:hypothetical protein SAMD00024442_99_4 [Candidatus Symbiothrix dinenymphae]
MTDWQLPGSTLMTSAYLAPIDYYMQLNRASSVIVEGWDNYVKQTFRNRCVIATANGLQTLSIPIEKPGTAKCLTRDIRIAEHGNWRNLHWNAIVSAYRSSPFFDYYEDDFRPFYATRQGFLVDFNEQLEQLVCSLLGIEPKITHSSVYLTATPSTIDLREAIHPKKPPVNAVFKPYYQVFATRNGFQPNLSIIDLLFNMGNEAVLFL